MTDDDRSPTTVGRHSITEEVWAGGAGLPILEDDEVHHLRAEVDIEVSGADSDRPHTYALLEEIEEAVTETVEEFDGGDGGDRA